MDLQYFGANCIQINTKKSSIMVDPFSDIATLKPDLKKVNTILASQSAYLPNDTQSAFVIDGPGEYEFEDYSIKGIAAQSHTAASGDNSATIYRFSAGDTTILFVGNIDAKLSEEQLEEFGMIDILAVPVGGNGYTLDAIGAATVARMIEPKVIIPLHSEDDGLKYEVPQQPRDLFIKELGAPVAEDVPEKYKIKTFPEQLTIQLLKRQ